MWIFLQGTRIFEKQEMSIHAVGSRFPGKEVGLNPLFYSGSYVLRVSKNIFGTKL
jgi:hypothetical protein